MYHWLLKPGQCIILLWNSKYLDRCNKGELLVTLNLLLAYRVPNKYMPKFLSRVSLS